MICQDTQSTGGTPHEFVGLENKKVTEGSLARINADLELQVENLKRDLRALELASSDLIKTRDNEIWLLLKALAHQTTRELFLSKVDVSTYPDLRFEGGMAHIVGRFLAKQFVKSGARNYIEMTFTETPGEDFIVTLQRKSGKTPHTLLREAEEKIRELTNAN